MIDLDVPGLCQGKGTEVFIVSEFHYNSHALSVMEYDSMGRETQRLHGNEIITAQDYDPQGRLAQQTIKKTQSPQQHFKQHFTQQRHYHYDAQGRINRIEDQLRGDCHYHYDLNDRLTRVTGVDPEQFIFDPASTLMDKDASSDNTRGRRLSFYGDAHYSYDQRGNRTDKKYGKNQCLHSQYHYNDLNQLIALKQGQEITHYQYDPLGRRIRKINRVRTEFLWCEDVLLCESQYSLEPVQPYTQPVALTARWYLFEPESFRPLAFDEGGQLYYYHLDHLGTPREITDSQGQLVWAVAYQAYGNVVRAYQQSITNPLRFQGQYYDQESGLHYNRFRYYDPDCGAYISQNFFDVFDIFGVITDYKWVPGRISLNMSE